MIQARHRIPPLVLSSLFHEWGLPFAKAWSKHPMLQICACIGDVQSIRRLSQIIFLVYLLSVFFCPQSPQTFCFRSFASGFFLISASSESCSAFPWSNYPTWPFILSSFEFGESMSIRNHRLIAQQWISWIQKFDLLPCHNCLESALLSRHNEHFERLE